MAARLEVIRACSERVARVLIEQDYSRGIGKRCVCEMGWTQPYVGRTGQQTSIAGR